MKILFPWGKGLGTLGFKFKSGFYFDIFNVFRWYELLRCNPGIFIFNPHRKPGSWSCKHCTGRVECLTRPACYSIRTWWFPFQRRVNVRG